MITIDDIIEKILNDVSLSTTYLNIKEYPLPKAYCPDDNSNIKAFILGTDPSNFSDNKQTKLVEYVFDLGKDKRYFNSINQNLNEIGLRLENVFVQNMVRNYMNKETSSNPYWDPYAEIWIPYVKQEFDSIDPHRKLPVFLTAHCILKILLLNPSDLGIPSDYYLGLREIPILPAQNKLERNLIPFYRHSFYSLKHRETYRDKIKEMLRNIN
jgi:hypothetical protein